MTAAKRKTETIQKPTPRRLATLDEMLDEALDETFPASDAVVLTLPSNTARIRARTEKLAGEKGNLRRGPTLRRRSDTTFRWKE